MCGLGTRSVRCVFLLTLLLGAFAATSYSQSVPGKCVSVETICPWGRVRTACDAPHPCPGSGTSTSSGSTNGGLIGVLLCAVIPLPGCPAKADTSKQEAYELNKLGNVEYSRGNWAAAIRNYELALQYSPNDPVIRDNLEKARAHLREQKAEERYAAARAERDLGYAAAAKGDWALATLYFQRAALSAPYDPEIKQGLENAKSNLRSAARRAADERAEANKQAAVEIGSSVTKTAAALVPLSSERVALRRAGSKSSGTGTGSKSALDDLRAVTGTGNEAKQAASGDQKQNEIPQDLGLLGWDDKGRSPVALPTVAGVDGAPVEKPIVIRRGLENDPRVLELQKRRADAKVDREAADKEVTRIKELKNQPGANLPELNKQLVDARSKSDIAKNQEATAAADLTINFSEERIPPTQPVAPVEPPKKPL